MKSNDSSGGFYRDLASRASNAAVNWFTPVVSWFGSWMPVTQPVNLRSASSKVAESLMMEVIHQGRILEERQERRQNELKLASGAVDYRYRMGHIL